MLFLIATKFNMISCLVYKMLKNVIHCFPKPKMTSSNVLFIHNPKRSVYYQGGGKKPENICIYESGFRDYLIFRYYLFCFLEKNILAD